MNVLESTWNAELETLQRRRHNAAEVKRNAEYPPPAHEPHPLAAQLVTVAEQLRLLKASLHAGSVMRATGSAS
jgi:hypothetical protein